MSINQRSNLCRAIGLTQGSIESAEMNISNKEYLMEGLIINLKKIEILLNEILEKENGK